MQIENHHVVYVSSYCTINHIIDRASNEDLRRAHAHSTEAKDARQVQTLKILLSRIKSTVRYVRCSTYYTRVHS
jgi:hypothetical protein